MKRKTLKQFLKEHRNDIDTFILNLIRKNITDEQRKKWIIHNEDLYKWARSEGVKI